MAWHLFRAKSLPDQMLTYTLENTFEWMFIWNWNTIQDMNLKIYCLQNVNYFSQASMGVQSNLWAFEYKSS